eukprot:SAG31_NODE_8114_length_1520_cov_2.197748_1_plen_111_part_00
MSAFVCRLLGLTPLAANPADPADPALAETSLSMCKWSAALTPAPMHRVAVARRLPGRQAPSNSTPARVTMVVTALGLLLAILARSAFSACNRCPSLARGQLMRPVAFPRF